MKSEVTSNIACIIALEDCIRATKKYTKGAFRKTVVHPIQGEEFPSKVLTEYYEVYPNTDIHWDMPIGQGIELVTGYARHIDVLFKYDYRVNVASISVHDGIGAMSELENKIPGFKDALVKAKEKDNNN